MNSELTKQILDELFPFLEAVDTRSTAVLQLLKDKGMTTEEQFAPYLAQAGNMSNVKCLAARVRIEHLLSSAAFEAEKTVKPATQNDRSKDDGSAAQGETGKPAAETNSKERGSQAPPATKKETGEKQEGDLAGKRTGMDSEVEQPAKSAASPAKASPDEKAGADTSGKKSS